MNEQSLYQGCVWWEQISGPMRFVRQIGNCWKSRESAVLQVPEKLPWRESLYSAADRNRFSVCGQRRLIRREWEPDENPGIYVMRHFCTRQLEARYWPGVSCGKFLAELPDLPLNECDIWISGIHDRTDLLRWVEFLREYESNCPAGRRHASFLLEYDGPKVSSPGIRQIVYQIGDFDCRVFCLEVAPECGSENRRILQAELARCIGGGNPQRCAKLLAAGDDLVKDPVPAAVSVLQQEGSDILTERQIISRIWRASIEICFPLLERFRMDFIEKHLEQLLPALPISSMTGRKISDPYDLEIGELRYIICLAGFDFTPRERETVKLCKEIRNQLAHNHLVSEQQIMKLMEAVK